MAVYKIDRLTRSLGDFGRIVEVFDKAGASFVSITQSFNTTTSMGRLTLNVLLSFAQFEREVTGERIRDKIAQSKAKGMWMGGNVLLGYDLKDRQLLINPKEAERVRHIYTRYLKLGSVHRLKDELEAQGIRSKAWTSLRGSPLGGQVFSRGALYHLLRNRHYLGEITHKTAAFPGQHPAIVDRALFDKVQALLAEHCTRSRGKSESRPAVLPHRLTGRLFDAEGDPMSPTTSIGRGGKRHRYYVSAPAAARGRPFGIPKPWSAPTGGLSSGGLPPCGAAAADRPAHPYLGGPALGAGAGGRQTRIHRAGARSPSSGEPRSSGPRPQRHQASPSPRRGGGGGGARRQAHPGSSGPEAAVPRRGARQIRIPPRPSLGASHRCGAGARAALRPQDRQ